MKNIKYLILIFGLLALLVHPSAVSAQSIVYEGFTPAVNNYVSFCDGYHNGLNDCNSTRSFSLQSDQIANAITLFDLGCNSRDEVEMFLSYQLVNADTHAVVAQTIHNRHLVCTPNYPPGHGLPTTLEIPSTKLIANQDYYIVLKASNNEHARAYWGVSSTNETSFQIHGVPFPKDPVVLVPGIMGSSLKRVLGGNEAWPNANEMILSGSDDYLDDLKLDPHGFQISGKELKPGAMLERASFSVFGQELLTQNFYADLVKQFTDRGYVLGSDLFEVAYDWRLDIRDSVASLQSAVNSARAASLGGKVTIVAHSMGGLLAKQYLSDPNKAALIDKVILVGAPQLGAPSMFKVLNYGDNLGFQFPIINKDILNSGKVKAISQNMPGVYELLPSRRYVDSAGGYVRDFRNGQEKTLSHEETQSLMTAKSSDSRNPELLSSAEDFHQILDNKSIAGPTVYNIASCGNFATVGEIRLYDNGKIDISGTDGDGTVPLSSAMHFSGDYLNYFVSEPETGVNHGGLVKDFRVTSLIERLAEGVKFSLPSGIGTYPEVCPGSSGSGADMLRFSAHSSGALHVYDSAGHHTGPLSDGITELGVQGSTYAVFGDNSFVFVPVGDDYRVAIEGSEEDSFTLKAGKLDGSNLVASANYINIPMAGDSSLAEATFSDSVLDPQLSVDGNGDGIIDAAFGPNEFLSGDMARDFLPPEIIISGAPTGTISAGTAFTVNFSASDDLSGMAFVNADFDGVQFDSGAVLSSSLIGPHKIVIQATDNAGNPASINLEFNQVSTGQDPLPSEPLGTPSPQVPSPSPQDPPSAPPAGESDGNGSNGGGSGSSGRGNRNKKATGSVLGSATTTSILSSATSSVVSCLQPPLVSLGRSGAGNDPDQVKLLQSFLSRELKLNIPVSGFFGPITELAVKIFQLKYYSDILVPADISTPTGLVGKYTLLKIAALACK